MGSSETPMGNNSSKMLRELSGATHTLTQVQVHPRNRLPIDREHQKEPNHKGWRSDSDVSTDDQGLLCAAGLVTGEAMVGILLALPIALSSVWPSLAGDPFQLFADPPLGGWPGLVALSFVGLLLVRAAQAKGHAEHGHSTQSGI